MSIGTIWNHRDFIKREYGQEAAVEFDQIVRNYQAEQISIERERIIKLLDIVEYPYGNKTKFQTLADAVFEGEMLFGDFRLELIALIKGENKIVVSANDAEQLSEALEAPVQPSEALQKLFKGENK